MAMNGAALRGQPRAAVPTKGTTQRGKIPAADGGALVAGIPSASLRAGFRLHKCLR